nr:LemA family protein [Saprospiraceae bacterium]
MVALIIVGVVAVLLVLMGISYYNRFVRLKNKVEDGWSGIDVQLKRRYDLIPNLLETVKGYATHEKDIFDNVSDARARALGAGGRGEQIAAENQLTGALRSLFAIAENYPDLKANSNFQQFQQQLAKIEDEIQMSRRYYNATVREFNTGIAVFPANIIASAFNFSPYQFFELEDHTQRDAPKVKF